MAYGEARNSNLIGYLAMPADVSEPLPGGVIVIHEWWGLNDNIKAMTRRLASEGFVALLSVFMAARSHRHRRRRKR